MVSVATTLFLIGASGPACSSTPKVCTSAEVTACDNSLNTCLTKSPCDDATNAMFQACVDACKKQHCSCLTACGSTCTAS